MMKTSLGRSYCQGLGFEELSPQNPVGNSIHTPSPPTESIPTPENMIFGLLCAQLALATSP